MKVSWDKVFDIVMGHIGDLVVIAEGLFSWKEKSGPDKKAFVEDSLHRVVDGIAEESTGGQADFWGGVKDDVGALIDLGVSIANKSGAFEGPVVSPVNPNPDDV